MHKVTFKIGSEPYIAESLQIHLLNVVRDLDLKTVEEDIAGIKNVEITSEDEKELLKTEQYRMDLAYYDHMTMEERKGVPYEWQNEIYFCDSYKDITTLGGFFDRSLKESYETSDVLKILEAWREFLIDFNKYGKNTQERVLEL